MPALPYVGSLYDYSRGPGANISNLLLEQGRARAAGADRIGQIWANTVQNLGQIPQQAQEQKLRELQIQEQANERQARTAELEAQTKEREQHTRDLAEQSQREAILSEKLDSGQPVATTDFYRALGMEKGFNAYKAYSELQKPQPDLKTVAIGFNGLSDEEKAKRWPTVAAKMAQAHGADPSIIPGEFNQGWLDNLLESNGWAPKKEESKKYKVTVPGPGGVPIAKLATEEDLNNGVQEYREPKAPKDTTAADDRRMDASYKLETGRLDAIGKPLREQGERFSRLVETINQKSPQADALIAPELLTVMAGGVGSGLRMNEAEIQRIVGGRTNWESIKAAANKWQLDPDKGLSVTDSQREQVRKLIGTMYERINKRTDLLDKANQDLINAKDVDEQRKIVANTKAELNKIASPEDSGEHKVGEIKKFPNGRTGVWDGHGWVAQ